MEEIEIARLRRAFRAIRDGYSVVTLDNAKIYVKHLSSLERSEIDAEQVFFFDAAVRKGLLTEKDQILELEKQGIWTKADQQKIDELEAYIKNLRDTKANLVSWQLDAINKQIESSSKTVDAKKKMRASVLGMTAEEFAARKLNELYICFSFFKDKTFEQPILTREDIEYFDDFDLGRFVSLYNEAMREVTESTIKKVAITRFFQDLYSLCEKDTFKFFGRPIADLTYCQCDLAIYGRFFNIILSDETKPPADVMDDPDKIIEWHQSTKNAKKELERAAKDIVDNGGIQQAQSLVGATQKDYKDMGMAAESGGPSLASLAAKSGGKLNKAEMLKYLHGRKV